MMTPPRLARPDFDVITIEPAPTKLAIFMVYPPCFFRPSMLSHKGQKRASRRRGKDIAASPARLPPNDILSAHDLRKANAQESSLRRIRGSRGLTAQPLPDAPERRA